MRDYKHVRVPRSERTARNRVVTKRVQAEPAGSRRASGSPGNGGTILALIIIAALGYGAWEGYRWLSRAEMFQVAGVDVKGVRRVSDDEVRRLAGMFTGENIFHVDLDSATRKALANPWVRNVRIERSLPNRISMAIVERDPRAVLAASNGKFLVDREAVVIVPADASAAAGLPTRSVRERVSPRSTVNGDGMTAALELLEQLENRGGWDMAGVTLRADSAEMVAILYADHEFRMGSGNYDEKLRRLGEIVSDLNQRQIPYVYVELRPDRQAAAMIKTQARGKGPGVRAQGRKRRA